jgi:DHA2 family multidrug resistance protein
MNYDAIWAGVAVCPLGIAPVCFSLITPFLVRKLGNVLVLVIGFVFFMIASFYSAYFTTAVDIWHIAFSRFIYGFGFVCYMAPLISIAVQEIPAEKLPMATGIFHFFRAMVGGIGTSAFTTLWQRRTIFHHERVGSYMSKFNPVIPQATDHPSQALLNRSLDQQASLLSINDAFFLMGWLYVFLIVFFIGYYLFTFRKPLATPPTHHIVSAE